MTLRGILLLSGIGTENIEKKKQVAEPSIENKFMMYHLMEFSKDGVQQMK